ncbi:hypothetical protein AB4Z48_15320 [Cupriavidus sp. 2TAF22]|uniref:hypothetical protein n=1 Tax=unclassified Cupriavidus TaxID=2640874 RepID=UPI003F8E0C36
MTKPVSPKQPAPPKPAKQAPVPGKGTPEPGADHQEDELDEALRETFPASDPISVDTAHGK